MNLETQLKEGEQSARPHLEDHGCCAASLAIAFAVVILIWPNIGLATLIALFGAFALVSGVATIAGAFSLPTGAGERGWLVLRGPARNRDRRRRLHLARPLGAGTALRHRRVGDRHGHLRDRPRVRSPAQRRTVAAPRAGRTALGRVRRDHVRPARRGSGRAAGARRGVRARDRRHADRLRARAAARRRRARASRPATRDGEARDAGLGEESEVQTIGAAQATAFVVMCVGALMVRAGVANCRLAWRPRRPNRERRRRP